ncbi:MAG: hypothetical protein RLZZ352_1212 [Pseudomonadota bacterium]|jgi:acetyl-CoA acetyltransferase
MPHIICPVTISQKKGDPVVVDTDEHPRKTSLEALAKLKGVVKQLIAPDFVPCDDQNKHQKQPWHKTVL